jgi:hypothetical protein
MDPSTAGHENTGGIRRVLFGGGLALAVIAVAVIVTLVGYAHEPAPPQRIAATEPSLQVPAADRVAPATTTSSAAPETTTTPAVPLSVPELTPATPPPPTTVPPPGPTVALSGPTVVTPGGEFQWHSQVTGAVSGTWSGTVLSGEKGAGATSPWSSPDGVFGWKDPSLRLEGGTYTITLTVTDASGRSAQATEVVTYP